MHFTNPISLRSLPLVQFAEPPSHRPEISQQRDVVAESTSVTLQSNYDSDLACQRNLTTPASFDPENQTGASHRASEDPYGLSTKLKSTVEIREMKHGLSRQSSLTNLVSKDANKARTLRHFYKSQNENIERFLKPIHEHRRQAKEEQDDTSTQFRLAFYGSFVANVCLAILQIFGAAYSGSLSLFTTAADAIFDPCSNLTLILCRRAIKKVDQRKYPQGKARIETAGNITFCFLMTSVSFILIGLSSKELADGSETLTSDFHWPSIMAVGIAIVTKFVLFLYCGALRKRFSQINILYEDHRNDLIINTVGLATSILGSKVRWWIDPMGAVCLSVLISVLWLSTAWSEFQLLIGRSADTRLLQHITYIAATHSDLITALDTVRAWHSGPRLIVEVDIVMAEDKTLRETHDVAEDLQTKLESLPDVDRAYVHVDHETSHTPEHFLKKEL